jgi:hypothetical protein
MGNPLPLRGCPPKGGLIYRLNENFDRLRIYPHLGGQGGPTFENNFFRDEFLVPCTSPLPDAKQLFPSRL